MNLAGLILIGSLVLIVALQIVQPFLGALAAVLWCAGATVLGFHIIQESLPYHFFFLPRDPILFGVTMLGFTGYSVYNLFRTIGHRKKKMSGFNGQSAGLTLGGNDQR